MITFTIKNYAEHRYWCAEWPTRRGVEHLESYGHDTAKDAAARLRRLEGIVTMTANNEGEPDGTVNDRPA